MANLKLWAYDPFELILHAEQHYLVGNDFDKRIALIGFDNSIEVSITTYLSLDPIQRGNRTYEKPYSQKSLENYHSKIDFYYEELHRRNLNQLCDKGDIRWCHDHRNDQYHEGRKGIPNSRTLENIRKAALWIFSVLFDISDTELILKEEIGKLSAIKDIPQRSAIEDKIIDEVCGILKIGSERYYASELLYAYDPTAYRNLAIELKEIPSEEGDE